MGKRAAVVNRLALGQPNQEDLVDLVAKKADITTEMIREAVVDLSPWFRNSI